jgi:hypothetical protein
MVTVYDWSPLTKRQVNRYAWLYTQAEFVRHGVKLLDETGDHQADFGVTAIREYGVKVRGYRWFDRPRYQNYPFVEKEKLTLREELLVLLEDQCPPEVFLIPSLAWRQPTRLLVDRDYGEGRKSPPEWGIVLTKSTLPLLEPFQMERQVRNL